MCASGEELGHRKRVAAAGIVTFLHSGFTIAVLLPEGNGREVVGCGLKTDLANAFGGEVMLGLG